MNKKDLQILIEQIVGQEISQDQKKLRRNRFKAQQIDLNNMDVNTEQGRTNIINNIRSTFSAVATRANILYKKSGNVLSAATKEEFGELVAEMMDNTVTLINRDYPNFVKTYAEVSKLLGLPPMVNEANVTLDTPEGRRNIIRGVVNSIGKLKKVSDEADKMILTADSTSNVAIFKNEIKALGSKAREIKAEALVLDRIFTQTFPNDYKKFKTQQMLRTSNPPPVPTR